MNVETVCKNIKQNINGRSTMPKVIPRRGIASFPTMSCSAWRGSSTEARKNNEYGIMIVMEKELRQITDHLLLCGSFLRDIGLFHGKMGIVVTLYMYAEKHNDKLLEEYAWDLFQQVYDSIHADMPFGLENGLVGIGYGTTLLYKHGIVDCDLNEVLTDVDSKIMERDPRRMKDLSVRTGVAGLIRYLNLRQSTDRPLTTFDGQFLSDLQVAAELMTTGYKDLGIMDIIEQPSFAINEYAEHPIGIDGGCAYYILKHALK